MWNGRSFKYIFLYLLILIFTYFFIANPIASYAEITSFTETASNLRNTSQQPLPPIHYSNENVDLSAQYSDLVGFLLNGKLTKKINPTNAISLELDYGKNENRIGLTWGTKISLSQYFKITAERLSENLPFTFTTGTINQTIPQYAYGAAYEYIFSNQYLNDFTIGFYQANAKNKSLDPLYFVSNGNQYINYRHIAGAMSQGVNVGFDSLLWAGSDIQIMLNYDHVQYHNIYNLIDTAKNKSRLGYTINFIQALSKKLSVNILASQREVYDDYKIETNWLYPIALNSIETGISIERIISHNSVPNDYRYALNFKLNLEKIINFKEVKKDKISTNLITWTKIPAIHMNRVLAAADEEIKKIGVELQSITPNFGTYGTLVTLFGRGFTPDSTVTFDGIPAGYNGIVSSGIIFVSNTILQAIAPLHTPGSVSISVQNPGGSSVTVQNAFTYMLPPNLPNLSSVSPNSGTTSGGTSVTLSGSGFIGTTAVTFGGTAATSVTVVNDTTITCTTPAHTAGTVDIVVTNTVGSNTLTNGFTYLAAPALTSVSPNTGITTGGTSVTINGSGFTGATAVTFGGTAATSVTVINDTTITCTTPAHTAAGTVDVAITNTVGSNTLTNGFTYLAAPALTSVSPNTGITTGGTSVTINGSGFTGATAVTFGGTAATSVTVVNDTTITCTTPAHTTAGAVDVAVTNTVGSNTLTNGFTYLTTPVPTNVSPNMGATNGGTSVTLSGSGFTGVTAVTFGGAAATNVVVVNDTTITCLIPAHVAGTVDVVVTNPIGSGTLTNGFTYLAAPAPTSVTPNTGLSTGLLPVTITGSGFTGATGVTFGETAATLVVIVNDNTITCLTPAHASGTVNVVVSNPVFSGTLINGFTYLL